MRVVVTGSRGFVGTWLVRHLHDCGDTVEAIDSEVDVTDTEALRASVIASQADCVVHLAGLSSVASSWGESRSTYEVNTVGTANLLDAAAACSRPPRVLVVSSSEVYGRVSKADMPVREAHPVAPMSPYAASKAAAELVALQMWRTRGLQVVIARPFNHTGPGQRADFVVPALAKQVAKAQTSGAATLRTGNLDVSRDISDVRDVVAAYRLLLEHGEPGGVYNVCRGKSMPIREIAQRLLELAGVDIPIFIDPDRVRPVDIPDMRGDAGKLMSATGWEPTVELDRTLADVLDYWKAEEGQQG